MRKYIQISFVLLVFGTLVLFRQLKGNDMPPVGQKNNQNQLPTPTPGSSSNSNPSTTPAASYKNGVYTGSVQDAFYGSMQVQVTINNSKISNVNFLQYPNDNRTSQFVNSQAMPILQQEAIQAQSAQVDAVSGASATSQAFQQSLADALSQAKQ